MKNKIKEDVEILMEGTDTAIAITKNGRLLCGTTFDLLMLFNELINGFKELNGIDEEMLKNVFLISLEGNKNKNRIKKYLDKILEEQLRQFEGEK